MEKKAIFFDIDGTLTARNPGGVIPQSTLEALGQLQKNGHFVAIATGRSQKSAAPFARQCRIHSYVHDGGFGMTVDDRLIFNKPLDHDKSLKIIAECIEKDIPLCVAIDNTYTRLSHNDRFNVEDEMTRHDYPVTVIPGLDYAGLAEIHKIYIALKPGEEGRLETLSLLNYSRYFPEYLMVEPNDKIGGIMEMMKYLKLKQDSLVVFGDGHNDLSMIKAAPVSVAMGNAADTVKAAATFVTRSSDDDGIAFACRHFGWI